MRFIELMKKYFLMMVVAVAAMTMGLDACGGDDWKEEQSHWACDQIGGVWESPNTDGDIVNSVKVDYYELSIKIDGRRGAQNIYAIAQVIGDKKYVTEYGYMGHPNGEPDNIINYVNQKRGTGYRWTFEWGNGTHTQFKFNEKVWSKTNREVWTYNW